MTEDHTNNTKVHAIDITLIATIPTSSMDTSINWLTGLSGNISSAASGFIVLSLGGVTGHQVVSNA